MHIYNTNVLEHEGVLGEVTDVLSIKYIKDTK